MDSVYRLVSETLFRRLEYAVAHWLRHYARSRKVMGSRSVDVNEFFSIYLILPAALSPRVQSASIRN
jgi:hypothetical protein